MPSKKEYIRTVHFLKNQFARIEPSLPEELENMVQCFAIKHLLAGQDPEQLAVPAANN